MNYITAYDNLNDIVYSERYSLSEQLIPMIQEVNYQYVAWKDEENDEIYTVVPYKNFRICPEITW